MLGLTLFGVHMCLHVSGVIRLLVYVVTKKESVRAEIHGLFVKTLMLVIRLFLY